MASTEEADLIYKGCQATALAREGAIVATSFAVHMAIATVQGKCSFNFRRLQWAFRRNNESEFRYQFGNCPTIGRETQRAESSEKIVFCTARKGEVLGKP